MKIVVFNLNGRGGMLHYSSQFSNALAKNHDIRVVLPSYSDTRLYNKDIALWKIRTNPTFFSFFLDSINIFAHIGLVWKIWKFRPEIIQIMDNHPWYFFYPLIGKCIGAKIYVTQHDPFPHSGERKGLFHKVAIWVNASLRKICDRLIVHEETMKQKVHEIYNIPLSKIQAIPHGSYDFLERNTKISKEPTTFLFFGRIVAYKGLDILLEAIELLNTSSKIPFTLIIAGEGDISLYEEKIKKLSSHIELHNGYIPDEEVRDFFSRSSFVVLPYRDATASGVIPLAYSFSLPVIATDVGVLSSYVSPGKTGFLVKGEDPVALKEKIELLLSDPKLVEELGQGGFEFQKNHLSWEAIVGKIY